MAGGEPSTLYVGGGLVDVGGVDPAHRAVLVSRELITWTGADPGDVPGRVDEVVDLDGAWLAPGFVDAHVHATATGLQAVGVALSGARSAAELLDAVRDHAARTPGAVVQGSGWDDMGWPEGRPPTADELATAAPGRTVVLTRVDGHSCLVDAGTLADLDLTAVDPVHVARDDEGQPTGWLLESASGVALTAMRRALGPDDLADARRAACEAALDLGITSLHEMAVPTIGDLEDAGLWAQGAWPIEVIAYWADLEHWTDAAPDADTQGLRPGGDLFLDGSIGSCTAACTTPYATNDGGTTTGQLFHPDEAVAAFFTAATRRGVGAGVHAIGDRAIGQAVAAIRTAADVCGTTAVRGARHRIEHAELATRAQLAEMAELGVVASVQPAFDAAWNNPGGLYEWRFGRAAADRTNPLAWMAQAGVAMCLSSDSTVTPLDPWGGVRAAERHHGGLGLSRRDALHAATLGGHHVVNREHLVGALRPGLRADLVAWPGNPLHEQPWGWRPLAVVAGGTRRR